MIRVGNKKLGDTGEYIGRPSVLGNPFSSKPSKLAVTSTSSVKESIALYRSWFYEQVKSNIKVQAELGRLLKIAMEGDLTLVCWCKDKYGRGYCHGDVIMEFLEDLLPNERI